MKPIFQKPTFLAAFAISLVGAFASTAQAGPQHNCNNYAAQAVVDYEKAAFNSCGVSGLGWTADFNMHKSWCEMPHITMADLTKWDRMRKDAVSKCVKTIQAPKTPVKIYTMSKKCSDGQNAVETAGFQAVKLYSHEGVLCRFTGEKQGEKYRIDTSHNSLAGAKIVGFDKL